MGEKPKSGTLELTLNEACTRYYDEVGARAKAADQEDARLAWICENFALDRDGANTKLSAIDENMILALAARRRAAGRLGVKKKRKDGDGGGWRPCSEYTVNRLLDVLRAVLRRAAITWKANVAAIAWTGLYTPRSREGLTGREMSAAKETEAFAAMRLDVRELAEFLLIHGVRSGRALSQMEWAHVDFDAGTFKVLKKTKLLGDHYQEAPMTERSRMLLLAQRRRHPKYVWTYVVHRSHVVGKKVYRPGDRKPITKSVMRAQVGRALREAMGRFRIHDLRHTAARRTLRASKNLRAVQRVLGHADISTTAIYADVLLEDVRDALEQTAAANPPRSPGAGECFTGHEVEEKGKNRA
ncbi:MAG: tyrosine-type recombinase/integrase [Vitreimonas sp.]